MFDNVVLFMINCIKRWYGYTFVCLRTNFLFSKMRTLQAPSTAYNISKFKRIEIHFNF